jgi:N-acetyl-gamma-glutamyl-phosphate reductase
MWNPLRITLESLFGRTVMNSRLRIGVVGGTGYAGAELLRILAQHPLAEVSSITSRADAGLRVDTLFPNLRKRIDGVFRAPADAALEKCDAVFFATPHGVAMKLAPVLLDAGVRVIDLSADFRLRDVAVWERWYGHQHTAAGLAVTAVYGLPERNRDAIRKANLIAVPGCYPTAIQLGFLPLLERGLIEADSLVASAASGVSGAGRQAGIDNLLAECSDSIKAYAVPGHRHLPEIEQELQGCTTERVQLTFVPHLAPMIRGIHATLVARLRDTGADLQAVFEQRYASDPAIDVMPAGSHPQTRSVRASNLCRLAIHRPQNRDTVVVLSVIDNLVKGAAGQAVQNLNIMFGIPENTGLESIPISP